MRRHVELLCILSRALIIGAPVAYCPVTESQGLPALSREACRPDELGLEIVEEAVRRIKAPEPRLNSHPPLTSHALLQAKQASLDAFESTSRLIDAAESPASKLQKFNPFLQTIPFTVVRTKIESEILSNKPRSEIKNFTARELTKAFQLYQQLTATAESLASILQKGSPAEIKNFQTNTLEALRIDAFKNGTDANTFNDILKTRLLENLKKKISSFAAEWHTKNPDGRWPEFKNEIHTAFKTVPTLVNDEDFLFDLHQKLGWAALLPAIQSFGLFPEIKLEIRDMILAGSTKQQVQFYISEKSNFIQGCLLKAENTVKNAFGQYGAFADKSPGVAKQLSAATSELLSECAPDNVSPAFLKMLFERLRDARIEVLYSSFEKWIAENPDATFEQFKKSPFFAYFVDGSESSGTLKDPRSFFLTQIFTPIISNILKKARENGHLLESPGSLEERKIAQQEIDELYKNLIELNSKHGEFIDISTIKQRESKIRKQEYFAAEFSTDSTASLSTKRWADLKTSGILKYFNSRDIQQAAATIQTTQILNSLDKVMTKAFLEVKNKSIIKDKFYQNRFEELDKTARSKLEKQWKLAKSKLAVVKSDFPDFVLSLSDYEESFWNRLNELSRSAQLLAQDSKRITQVETLVSSVERKIKEAARFWVAIEKARTPNESSLYKISEAAIRESYRTAPERVPFEMLRAKSEEEFKIKLADSVGADLKTLMALAPTIKLNRVEDAYNQAKLKLWAETIADSDDLPTNIVLDKMTSIGASRRAAAEMALSELSRSALAEDQAQRLSQLKKSEEPRFTLKGANETIRIKERDLHLQKKILDISKENRILFNWALFKKQRQELHQLSDAALEKWLVENPPPDDSWSEKGRRLTGGLLFNSLNYPHIYRSLWDADGYLRSRESLVEKFNGIFSTEGRSALVEGLDAENFQKDFAMNNPLFSAGAISGHMIEGIPLLFQYSTAGYASIADSIVAGELSSVSLADLERLEGNDGLSGGLATAGKYSRNTGLFLGGLALTAGAGSASLASVELEGLTLGQRAIAMTKFARPLAQMIISKPVRSSLYLGGSSAIGQEIYRIGSLDELYKKEGELIDEGKPGKMVTYPDLDFWNSMGNITSATADGMSSSQIFMGATTTMSRGIQKLVALNYAKIGARAARDATAAFAEGMKIGETWGAKATAFVDFAEGMSEFPDTIDMFDPKDIWSTKNMGAFVLFASNAYDTVDMSWATESFSKMHKTTQDIKALMSQRNERKNSSRTRAEHPFQALAPAEEFDFGFLIDEPKGQQP